MTRIRVPLFLAAFTFIGVAHEAAAQKVYFDAVKLAKLSRADAVASFKKNPIWAKVSVEKDGDVILRDGEAARADERNGDAGSAGPGARCYLIYDHGRLLKASLTFHERPAPEADKILAFAGITGAPRSTKTDDDRNKPPFTAFKTTGSVRFFWEQGFGPLKYVFASTRLPETTPQPGFSFVISRVDVEYVSKAVLKRWENSN